MSVEGSVRPRSAFCVVLGNEKGGSGKSTVAMHIAVALLKAGQRVATIERHLAGLPGLFVTGSGFRAIGIPDTIADARETAARAARFVRGERDQTARRG